MATRNGSILADINRHQAGFEDQLAQEGRMHRGAFEMFQPQIEVQRAQIARAASLKTGDSRRTSRSSGNRAGDAPAGPPPMMVMS